MNDAYVPYTTTPEMCRLNLCYMLERVKAALPHCECVLQCMNVCIDQHSEARPNLAAYYQVYRAVAAERRLTLVDHEPLWAVSPPRTLAVSATHPTSLVTASLRVCVRQAVLAQGGRDLFLSYCPDGIHPGPLGCEMVITPNIIDSCELHADDAQATSSMLPPSVVALLPPPVSCRSNHHGQQLQTSAQLNFAACGYQLNSQMKRLVGTGLAAGGGDPDHVVPPARSRGCGCWEDAEWSALCNYKFFTAQHNLCYHAFVTSAVLL
jgi:hypothetical protein